MKQIISNLTDDRERAFYGSRDTFFDNIIIAGPADGESAFKECKNISLNNCRFVLRYPLWHVNKFEVKNSLFEETCRAAVWYSKNIKINDSNCNGIKMFRECSKIVSKNSSYVSDEIFWRCNDIKINGGSINGVYAFNTCNDIQLNDVAFKGKYSFQYCNRVNINDSILDTKDAFWHTKDAVIANSKVMGEYLGWYSENLTFINCEISGTQPLCYCKNLVLINCTMKNCDLAFEYSSIHAEINSSVDSIKNPLSGSISVQKCDNIIFDENDRSHGKAIIKIVG